jgi:hypothetical protein
MESPVLWSTRMARLGGSAYRTQQSGIGIAGTASGSFEVAEIAVDQQGPDTRQRLREVDRKRACPRCRVRM